MHTSKDRVVVTRTVPAWQLRPGWIVIPDHGSPRRVTSNRLEGAPPRAIVEYAGVAHRIAYRTTDLLLVEDDQ